MKIIDLLNKIANGEEVPKKIKWGVHELNLYIYDYKEYDYKEKDELGNPSFTDLLENVFDKYVLNEEIEILEEPKGIPEKLYETSNIGDLTITYPSNKELMEKINEIIDYLESKGESND